jgi:hypothetical protein
VAARIVRIDHVYVKTVLPKNVKKVPHVLEGLLCRVLKPGQRSSILRLLQTRRNLEMLVEPVQSLAEDLMLLGRLRRRMWPSCVSYDECKETAFHPVRFGR